jgi:hypothetical protein
LEMRNLYPIINTHISTIQFLLKWQKSLSIFRKYHMNMNMNNQIQINLG